MRYRVNDNVRKTKPLVCRWSNPSTISAVIKATMFSASTPPLALPVYTSKRLSNPDDIITLMLMFKHKISCYMRFVMTVR